MAMDDIFRLDLLPGRTAYVAGGTSRINWGIAARFAEHRRQGDHGRTRRAARMREGERAEVREVRGQAASNSHS